MSQQHIRVLCREGGLPAIQVGGSRWYVPKKKFIEMVDSQISGQP